jgi:hypothetical protein
MQKLDHDIVLHTYNKNANFFCRNMTRASDHVVDDLQVRGNPECAELAKRLVAASEERDSNPAHAIRRSASRHIKAGKVGCVICGILRQMISSLIEMLN